jgi:hypothetical protein
LQQFAPDLPEQQQHQPDFQRVHPHHVLLQADGNPALRVNYAQQVEQ